MNEIQDGFVSRWLASRLGIVDAAPTPTLAPEVMPVMIAVPDSIENELQRGTWLCAAAGTAPAFAAVMSCFEIHNPVGSGVLMMIDNLRLGSVTINQTIQYGWYPADLPTPTLTQIFTAVSDSRVAYNSPPTTNNTAVRSKFRPSVASMARCASGWSHTSFSRREQLSAARTQRRTFLSSSRRIGASAKCNPLRCRDELG